MTDAPNPPEPVAPLEPQHYELLRGLAIMVDNALNPKGASRKVGFAILMFGMNENEGRMNYISNGERVDMISALKEFIAHLEGRVVQQPEKMQ